MSQPGEEPEDSGSARAGDLVIVTGMTGAGRSSAAKELEDVGFFVVDNLPPDMVADLVRLVDAEQGVDQPVAVVVDVRAGSFFEGLRETLAVELDSRRTTLLYLEADDDVLVRRQEAARRPHPLQGRGRLLDGIGRERKVLADLRGDADIVIDTTSLSPTQLKHRVAQAFGSPDTMRLQITVLSFGFKYGIPVDADLLADMRFLPNPHWVPELREKTGRDQAVSDYVTEREAAQTFLGQVVPLIGTVADGYAREGKRFMTAAIGCTGGKHRSVAMSEEITRRLVAAGHDTHVIHRDLGRE